MGKRVRGYSLNIVCLDAKLTRDGFVMLNNVNFTGPKIYLRKKLLGGAVGNI